jgi:hypothetical protein
MKKIKIYLNRIFSDKMEIKKLMKLLQKIKKKLNQALVYQSQKINLTNTQINPRK